MSGAPQSSSCTAANDTQRPTPLPRPHPEKAPSRGPFWARLPALRTMASTVGGSQSQADGSPGPTAHPPIVLPDRVSTTRILLSDTQACVQKLSARMDIIGSRIEQALKELQLAREALDAGGERTVAEIADIVYRCQATLSKNIEVQESILDKINGSIAKLTISSDALLKLYEAHSASLTSLTQTMHGILNTQQSAHVQHAQLVSTLAPLDPLVRSIPVHIDALVPNMERIIERSLERVLSRLPFGAYMREQVAQEPRTPRGQKRHRSPERDLPPIDASRVRRRSTLAPSELLAARDPSSPLLARQRSGTRGTERLQTLASLRRLPAEVASNVGALTEANEEMAVQQALASSFSRRTSRRPTLPMQSVSSIDESVNKRPRIDSTNHTGIVQGTDANALQASTCISNNAETVQAPTAGALIATSTHGTIHTAMKAQMPGDIITASRVPLGNPPPSANNGMNDLDNSVIQTPSGKAIGSENISADKIASGSAKSKSKTPKKKGDGAKRGRGRPKKATIAATPASATSLHQNPKKKTKPKPKTPSKDTSQKRAITGNSDVSAASEHGPPNSPSTHAKSSPILFGESKVASSSPIPEQITGPVTAEAPPANLAAPPKPRTLISLIDASQESFALAGQGDTAAAAGLTAALAHIDNDVNFTSRLGELSLGQENSNTCTVGLTSPTEESGNMLNMVNGGRRAENLPSEPGSTLFKGRTKRFIVIDNDSSENDILDELFAE